MAETNLELVQRGFEAASRGDVEAIAGLLAPDLYWGPPSPPPRAPGDGEGGCRNREQALRWMREGIARGVKVDLLEARELRDRRVLVLLQRNAPREGDAELPPPHGQIVTVRDGKIAEMVVYATADGALAAAGSG